MLRPHPARPHARQERGDRGMAAAQPTQRHAIAPMHRQRADDAAPGQMLHQAEKPGQVGGVHPLLVQRQDEVARRGAQRVVAVLHALGDAAERDHAADVVVRQEGGQRLVGDLGIDGHARSGRRGEILDDDWSPAACCPSGRRRALCRRPPLPATTAVPQEAPARIPESPMPARQPNLGWAPRAACCPGRRAAAAAGRLRPGTERVRARLPTSLVPGRRGRPGHLPAWHRARMARMT